MHLLEGLNFLATIGTFACISFALSGMGVKLGKLSSEPHRLGFNYISEIGDKGKIDKLYAATAKLNETLNSSAPPWAKNAKQLSDWCNKYQKSTRKLGENSHHCMLQNNVWHQLIKHGYEVTEPNEQETRTTEGEAAQDKCSYKILSKHADDENDINSLIGRKLCSKVRAGDSTPATTSISPVSSSAGV